MLVGPKGTSILYRLGFGYVNLKHFRLSINIQMNWVLWTMQTWEPYFFVVVSSRIVRKCYKGGLELKSYAKQKDDFEN